MKSWFIALSLLLFALRMSAEQPLEGIVVEKYYISGKREAKWTNDSLKAGSVTYRIYADLHTDYRLQAVYGVPGHPLSIKTTTDFYNSPTGSIYGSEVPFKKMLVGTTLLDSWITIGSSCESCYALPKDIDTTEAARHKDKLMRGANPAAGIPLTDKDGFYPASPIYQIVRYGLDSIQTSVFAVHAPVQGASFTSENGSWAVLLGLGGINRDNKILLAQVTTDGELSFKLNLQLVGPDGKTLNYVAEHPSEGEYAFPGLTYPANRLGSEHP